MSSLTIAPHQIDTASISGFAGKIFHQAPLLARIRLQLRSYFSPMHRLVALVPQHASVLDAGCGNGLFLALLAAKGTEGNLVGFDGSWSAIECAKQMQRELDQQGCPANLSFKHREKLEAWPRGEFNVVSLLDYLPSIPIQHQGKVFRTAVDHLAPGGLLLYKHVAMIFDSNAAELVQVQQWARVFDLKIAHQESLKGICCSYEIIGFRKPI